MHTDSRHTNFGENGAAIPGGEERLLRIAWAAAWLREYRCHGRYVALLTQDAVAELELRFAWLAWWDASCLCREAARRLDSPESL